MEAFFRSARRPSRSSEWTLEDAARFAALKEGYLLQFLSTHKKAFATRRVVLAFLCCSRNRCLPQPLRVGSNVDGLHATRPLVFCHQWAAPMLAAASVALRAPRRGRQGSRQQLHPHPPP